MDEAMHPVKGKVKHYDLIECNDEFVEARSGFDRDEHRRRPCATIRLGSYDGNSIPLETHISKFENCAKYYAWNETDRLCHLRASLDGAAGQILWELDDTATEREVIETLRNRFGSHSQSERFRAELRNRRRRKDESVQSVYNDIRRLLALAFPGKSGELYEIIGRDAFLESLADSALRNRVLDQNPKNMDDTLAIVSRMEAYSTGYNKDQNSSDDDVMRRRVRQVNVSQGNGDEARIATDRRLADLETSVAEQRRDLRQLLDETRRWQNQWTATTMQTMVPPIQSYQQWQPATSGPRTPNVTSPPVQPAVQPTAAGVAELGVPIPDYRTSKPAYRKQQGRQGTGCYLCGDPSHWKRQCPRMIEKQATSMLPSQGAFINGVSDKCHMSETYLIINVAGKLLHAMVDSGCERSVIPRKYVPKAHLEPTGTQLFAANGNQIPVLGRMNLCFTVNGVPLQTEVFVTDRVEELLLGYSFLAQYNCTWSFAEGILFVQGAPVKLKTRNSDVNVRRVYVREAVRVPPDVIVNVPVDVNYVNLRSPAGDWVTEAREIRPGLIAARTLISDFNNCTVVQFINVSGKQHYIRRRTFLGCATPGIVIGEHEKSSHDIITHCQQDDDDARLGRRGEAYGRPGAERVGRDVSEAAGADGHGQTVSAAQVIGRDESDAVWPDGRGEAAGAARADGHGVSI
jgi:hypothetical protein